MAAVKPVDEESALVPGTQNVAAGFDTPGKNRKKRDKKPGQIYLIKIGGQTERLDTLVGYSFYRIIPL